MKQIDHRPKAVPKTARQLTSGRPPAGGARIERSSGGSEPGSLTRLAAEINASQQVQSLTQLRQSIHESPRTLRQQYGSGDAIDDAAAQAKRREERFQAKPNEELRQHRDSNAASTGAAAEPASRSAGKSGLPPQLKSGVESLSGMSMDHVKVHYNSGKPAQLNALAYAQGSDIHVAPGQEKHLPHEAWHVVQQAQGRVRPTRQMKDSVPINDNKGLEHEADVMAQKASAAGAQLKSTAGNQGSKETLPPPPASPVNLAAVQRAANIAAPEGPALSVHVKSKTPAVLNGRQVAQLLLVRIRTQTAIGGRFISQLKIEGRAPTVVSGGQGDHSIAEGHLIFLLERLLEGKTHASLVDELTKILDHIESEITAKYLGEEGHFVTISSLFLGEAIAHYGSLVTGNAETSELNAALEDIVDNFIRLWNKRAGSAYERKEGKTTGGSGGPDERAAKKELHKLASHVDAEGSSDRLAADIGAQILRMVDFVPKGPGDLKEAAHHLAKALEMSITAIKEMEVDYETAANALVTLYAKKLGLPQAAGELIDLYVMTLLRGKDDYTDELEAELWEKLKPAVKQ